MMIAFVLFPCRLVSLCVPKQKEASCQYAVIAVCEHYGIKDVMQLKYDWDDEVIL
jgi:hypothetical protein